MPKPFPLDVPTLQGRFAPVTFEADAHDLPVLGRLPEGLFGTLYRNGPNPQYAPAGAYHWFAGDGMLHAFHVERGRVSYRNRWLRTPKWQIEHDLGEALARSDPRLATLDSTLANTNIVWHGGALLALEEQHAPFAVDPRTLAPLGTHDFAGVLRGPMTAHPKVDPRTGELVFFGYSPTAPFSPDAHLGAVSASGRLTQKETIALPFASMVHDFVVTERWLVLPVFPLRGSRERAASGGPAYAWEPALGSHVALVPRGGGVADARWFVGDPCYVFHFANAFDGPRGTVVVDAMKSPAAPLFPLADGTIQSETQSATLVRWTFDPRDSSGKGWCEEPLDDRPGEFPRFDERFTSLPYRHAYLRLDASLGHGAGIARVDIASRRVAEWRPDAGDTCDEPVFVPRSERAEEGDGWLLTVVYRHAENRSDLAVLDARDVAAGPVALVQLAHRVPSGFHGNWRPGAL
jgi:carotenoid cleavage dioxygenase-like enzyme